VQENRAGTEAATPRGSRAGVCPSDSGGGLQFSSDGDERSCNDERAEGPIANGQPRASPKGSGRAGSKRRIEPHGNVDIYAQRDPPAAPRLPRASPSWASIHEYCWSGAVVLSPRRTEALSDSTFAVAMTLLIFDVRLPSQKIHTLGYDLWFSSWPHYLGYAISFLVIGMIWVSHHTIYRLVRAIDHRVMVINLVLLGLVVFIPFPTQILALYISQGTASQKDLAVAFYGFTLAVATLMLAVLWHAICRRSLVQPWVTGPDLRRVRRRYYLTPALYLGATGLALVDDRLGILLFLAIGCGYLLHTGTRVAPPHPEDSTRANEIHEDMSA
jgi:uncharacterized membrane protein